MTEHLRVRDFYDFNDEEMEYMTKTGALLEELTGEGNYIEFGLKVLKGTVTMKGIVVNNTIPFEDMIKSFNEYKKEFRKRVLSAGSVVQYGPYACISAYAKWYAFWRTWLKYTYLLTTM